MLAVQLLWVNDSIKEYYFRKETLIEMVNQIINIIDFNNVKESNLSWKKVK